MHFEAKKVIVVGGSAGMGRQVALDVVDHGGSAVIVGRSKARVDDTVELMSRRGHAWGIAAELTDRAAIADVQRALSEHHGDATLLVNAAGFFIPKAFLEYDQQFYDSYMELNYALFFLTQTVVAGHDRPWGRRIHRQHRQHVGASGDRRDPIDWALDAKSRTSCAHP